MIVEKTAYYQLTEEEVNTLKKAARILDNLGDATRHNYPFGLAKDVSLVADSYKFGDTCIISNNENKTELNNYKYWR